MSHRPVLIGGPTASGKSALALRIAERDGGYIVNADALQVYACWRILTARPDHADLARAPHALFGHVSGAEHYSVGQWLRDVARVLDDAARRGLRPIIVGGTGLYLTALTEGLAPVPPIPPAVRARSSAILEGEDAGPERFRIELARDDPLTLAQIDARNPRRLQRAWEVLRASGRGLAAWQAEAQAPLVPDYLGVITRLDTAVLNKRIEARLDAMLEAGALDEVRTVRATIPRLASPAAQVIGAAELDAVLDGAISLQGARTAAIVATRQFAKRQRTWFRNRMAGWPRIDPTDLEATAEA